MRCVRRMPNVRHLRRPSELKRSSTGSKNIFLCFCTAFTTHPAGMRRRPKFSECFARALQKRRLEAGLSRQALAEKAGLHQTYVGLIERGKSNPSLDAVSGI